MSIATVSTDYISASDSRPIKETPRCDCDVSALVAPRKHQFGFIIPFDGAERSTADRFDPFVQQSPTF